MNVNNLENRDEHIVHFVEEHPTMHNITHAINVVTNNGVNALTHIALG